MPNANFSKRIIDTNIKRVKKIYPELDFEVTRNKHFKVNVNNRLNEKSKTFSVSCTPSSNLFPEHGASDFNDALEAVDEKKLPKNVYLISLHN